MLNDTVIACQTPDLSTIVFTIVSSVQPGDKFNDDTETSIMFDNYQVNISDRISIYQHPSLEPLEQLMKFINDKDNTITIKVRLSQLLCSQLLQLRFNYSTQLTTLITC